MCSTPNKSLVIFDNSTRLTTTNSEPQVNSYYKGVLLLLNVNTFTGGTSVTFKIQGYDPLSQAYYDILTGAAQTGTTSAPVAMTVYPGCVAVANTVANNVVPARFRVVATVAGTFSALKYTCQAYLID